MSGCIGLIPGSMKIVEGGIEAEAPLALRHVKRVIDVISPSSNLKDSIYGVCYVTSSNYLHIANYLWTQETQAVSWQLHFLLNPILNCFDILRSFGD